MSGYRNEWSDDEGFENETESQGGKGLRKMLEETLAENKRLIQKLEGRERETSTTALLKDKGIDPAIAAIIPSNEDPAEWVAKHGHLFGVQEVREDNREVAPEVQTPADDDPAVQARQRELADERKALADMQDAAESGFTAEVHDDLVNRMDKIESEEELLKFFTENGAPLD